MSSLFISHASADTTAARAASRRLEAWGYRSLFLDFDPDHGIAAGTDWEAQLYRHLKLSRAIVALVTEHFVASHWCFAEVIQARAMGKPVFPLKIEPCAPPSVLADVQIVDLTHNEEEGWERLRRGLEAAGLSEDFPFDAARPYPGLPAFDTGDAGVFHGREEEQAALIETLERMKRRGEPRLALVLGASGSGKSSLVRAGVLPRLGKDPRRWLVIPPWRPGDAPGRELARALAEAFDNESQRWRDIAATLEADASGRAWIALADDLREAKGQRDASVLLVIDQLEELFTRGAGGTAADAAASFRAQLRAALEAPGSPLFVLATLRSDFLDSFQVAPELRGLPFETLPLGPIPLDRLPRVITGPAARAGVELEDGLVERLVADTGSGEALPLLAFTLRQLWERRRNDRLTIELYERELGSIEGAVATIAEGIVAADLGSVEEQALRAAFLRMARLDDEGRLARRRAVWDELPERSRPVVERFVDERLLVSHTSDGVRHVEVAHEALFRAWRRLALWLEEERGMLHFRQRLDRARTEWLRVNKAEEALLQGPALAEAERWRETRPADFTADERAFVGASTARRQREINAIRRRRGLVVAGIVAALIVSGLAGWQWRTAELQRRRVAAGLLAAQADARLDASGEGLQQSLLLATESLRSAWTAEGYAAWARAVALAPRRPEVWIEAGGAAVVALDYHPTEAWVALAGSDGVVRIVDLNSRSTLQALPLVDGALDPPAQWPGATVRFSPDGIWLAAAGRRKLSIWNTRTWERWDGPVNTDGFFDIAFDRTSERLAFSGYRLPLRILAVASKRDLDPIPGARPDATQFRAIAFTATHLITATPTGQVAFWQVPVGDAALTKVRQIDLAGDTIHDIATGSTQQLLAMATDRAGLRLWSAAAVTEALRMAPDSPEQPGATQEPTRDLTARGLDEGRGSWRVQTPPVHTVAFGPGDEHLLTSSATAESRGTRFDPTIRLWSVRTGREVGRIYPGGPAAFASRGQSLVAGGSQPAVWSLPTRGSEASLSHSSEVRSVAFSADGRWLAAGLDDGTLVVRRTASWSDPVALKLGGPVRSVGFTPDSRWLVAQAGERSDATLHVLQTETWKPVPPRPHEDGFTVRVSPDSRFLLTHTPFQQDRYKGLTRASRSRLWEISTGAEVAWRSHEAEDKPATGRVSIAGGTLPLGQHGDMTVLEQAKEWPPLRPVPRAAGGMNDAVTSPDGRWLAGYGGPGASEGLALLEPATGRRLVMLRPEDDLIPDIAFSPDGRWLASAEGTSLDLWLLGPVEALIDEACTRLSRNLTVEEWSMFGNGTPPTTCDRLRVPPASAPARDKRPTP